MQNLAGNSGLVKNLITSSRHWHDETKMFASIRLFMEDPQMDNFSNESNTGKFVPSQQLEQVISRPYCPLIRHSDKFTTSNSKNSFHLKTSTQQTFSFSHNRKAMEARMYSRKVFIGGLPKGIEEYHIIKLFRNFGQLVVDWPYKSRNTSFFRPKGFAFLIFQDEKSVHNLLRECVHEEAVHKLYFIISFGKHDRTRVHIRPWLLKDAKFYSTSLKDSSLLDPYKRVFVGGVPRSIRAKELANIMNYVFGAVGYAQINTDYVLEYPRGFGCVFFLTHQSYVAAINQRFLYIVVDGTRKQIEVKPFESHFGNLNHTTQ